MLDSCELRFQADFTPYEGKSAAAAIINSGASAAQNHDADLALALQMQEVCSSRFVRHSFEPASLINCSHDSARCPLLRITPQAAKKARKLSTK